MPPKGNHRYLAYGLPLALNCVVNCSAVGTCVQKLTGVSHLFSGNGARGKQIGDVTRALDAYRNSMKQDAVFSAAMQGIRDWNALRSLGRNVYEHGVIALTQAMAPHRQRQPEAGPNGGPAVRPERGIH